MCYMTMMMKDGDFTILRYIIFAKKVHRYTTMKIILYTMVKCNVPSSNPVKNGLLSPITHITDKIMAFIFIYF